MQIRETNATAVSRTYTRQAGAVQDTPGGGSSSPARGVSRRARTDSLAVSDTLQQIARFRDRAAAQPDVRAERVASLRAQIAGGSYQVDTHALAQRLLE